MKFDQVANNCQAKSETAVRSRGRAVGLTKAFKHVRKKRGLNTWPIVFNLYENVGRRFAY